MVKTKILIAIDDPDWAGVIVHTLFNFIDKENSEIFLLNVLETTSAEEEYFYSYPEKFIKHEAGKSKFSYIENFFEKQNFQYKFIFEQGNAAEKILHTAQNIDADLVVTGSHNKKIFERMLLGSVSYKISRLCKCSVMIVSSKYHIHNIRKKDFNILLAVDGSEPSLYAAESIGKLIDKKRAKVQVLNVTIPPQEIIPPEAYIYTDIGRIITESKLVSQEILNNVSKILEEKGIFCEKKITLMGDPCNTIIDYAEKNSIDVIVLGAHSRKEISLLLTGSVNLKICEKSEIPVLIIKKK